MSGPGVILLIITLTENASALGNFFTDKFLAETESTHLNWSVRAFADF